MEVYILDNIRRILLKLSGEALSGGKGHGFDEATCLDVGRQVRTIVDQGVEVAIVIGGGNFWRGRASSKIIERTKYGSVHPVYLRDIYTAVQKGRCFKES